MTLDDYLAEQARTRFVWGESDCVQFGLRWAVNRVGRPLAAFFAYRTRDEAMDGLRARGGLRCVVDAWMDANGFRATDDPEDGDIGLAPVEALPVWGGQPVAVVIRRGPWWMSKEPRGIGGKQFDERIPAWRIL